MRRQQLHLASWSNAKLDAGAAQLNTVDAFLDDATSLGELPHEAV